MSRRASWKTSGLKLRPFTAISLMPGPSGFGGGMIRPVMMSALRSGRARWNIGIDVLRIAFPHFGQVGLGSVVNDLPSAILNAGQGGARTVIGEPLGPEAAPVIGRDLIESGDKIIEGVRLQSGGRGAPIEHVAKVIHRLRAVSLLPDDRIGPQPVQNIFLVVVGPAPPGGPGMRRALHGGTPSAVSCRLRQIRPGRWSRAAAMMAKLSRYCSGVRSAPPRA